MPTGPRRDCLHGLHGWTTLHQEYVQSIGNPKSRLNYYPDAQFLPGVIVGLRLIEVQVLAASDGYQEKRTPPPQT